MAAKKSTSKKRKPYNKSTGRDYKSDYRKFQSSPKQRAENNKRKRDRRKAEKEGRVKKGDGKHLDHSKGNARGKTSVMSAKKNLGKREKSRLKGSRRRRR